ncbi:MAG TPA: hypothetical protein VHW01_09060, partial [Polyangiaceae bacterium]|nr:hypothetical protein [Polyangiaceae bacterium]
MRSHPVPQPRYLFGTMPAAPTSLLDTPLLEPVLLRAAERRSEAISEAARARMKPFVAAALARYRVALELRDRESRGVALGLLRDSALLALSALEAVDSESLPEPRTPRAVWDRFMTRERPGAPGTLAEARIVLGSDDVLASDSVPASDANRLRASAEEAVSWLLGLAEARSPRELSRARLVRSSLLV